MDAVVTLLSLPQNAVIQEVWADLREQCGLKGIEVTPIPHFSWHAAGSYDLDKADELLARFAKELVSFNVRAGGLGLFMNQEPVLYLSVAKNRSLLDLHEQLWPTLNHLGADLNPYYSPDGWMPHITLAQWGLTVDRIACALTVLKEFDLSIDIQVDNLAIIRQTSRKVGALRAAFPFGTQGKM